MAPFAVAPHSRFVPHRPAAEQQEKAGQARGFIERCQDLAEMQRFRTFLDKRDACELGSGAEPQLYHVVAPVLADAGVALDEWRTAVPTSDHEAAPVERGAGVV